MDHLGLISHKLLVPGFSRSNQDKNSHIDITVSSQTDMMSALGLRSEMKKTSERMQSIILLSPTLNRRDDNFKGSQISNNARTQLASSILEKFQDQLIEENKNNSSESSNSESTSHKMVSTKKVIELENKNHDPNKAKIPSIRLRNINRKLGKIQKMKEGLNNKSTNNEKPVPKTKRTNDFTLKNTTPKAKMSSNTL